MDFLFTAHFKRVIALLLAVLPSLGMAQSISDGLIYTLPKSEFTLSGTVRTTSYSPGPLAAYAKKYLGIQVKEHSETSHQLLQSHLTLSLLPDTACLFQISSKALQNNRLDFGRGSMLLSVNAPACVPQRHADFSSKWNANTAGPDIPMLPILSLTQETDTIYRRELLADSVVVEHWEIQTLIQQKTTEEISKSTAQKLVQLDQDQQLLLRFNEDVQYSGSALRVMLQRLDSLENYYHELFQGRQLHRYSSFSFPLTLTTADLSELQLRGNLTKVIARFSTAAGFSSDTSQTTPLLLSIQGAGILQAVQRLQPKKEAQTTDGLMFRMPERCTIHIFLGNTLILRENQPIFQLGPLLRLPIPKSGMLNYSIWPEISNPESVEW